MGATPQIPVGTYDFSDVVCVLGGVVLLGGVSVKVTLDSPQTTDEVGANGDVVVTVNNDKRGAIEIEFMPSSPSLDYMSQLVMAFSNTGAFVPASVNDLSGRSKHSAAQAWVEKIADKSYGAASENVTFRVRAARLNDFVGGSV